MYKEIYKLSDFKYIFDLKIKGLITLEKFVT